MALFHTHSKYPEGDGITTSILNTKVRSIYDVYFLDDVAWTVTHSNKKML
jgi:hypothetical protein